MCVCERACEELVECKSKHKQFVKKRITKVLARDALSMRKRDEIGNVSNVYLTFATVVEDEVYDTLAISLENSFNILLMYPRWDAQYRGSYRTATLI